MKPYKKPIPPKSPKQDEKIPAQPEGTRLNKFIANAGECNRRQADAFIKSGLVTVNGKVVTEMGSKVIWKDKVHLNGKRVYPGEKVYVLLNKPKGYVGTNKPVEGKKTLNDLVYSASQAKLYVTDYLSTNALGLVLLTNDGHFAEHFGQGEKPVQQLYKVTLNKPLLQEHMDAILKGFQIEKESIKAASIAYADETEKVIGIEFRSAMKDAVTKIFTTLGYTVVTTDRVIYGGLTKKNLARGQWRFLTEKEVVQLKHFI
jgi:23S rRNA pseudouridine2605 synthase